MALFPKKDAEFNDYVNIVVPFLNTHAGRLQVSPAHLAELNTLHGQWQTTYPQSQNPDTATKTVIDNKNELRDDLEQELRDTYNDIPQSLLTTQDRNTLNLKKRDLQPTPRPTIESSPNVTMKCKEGRLMLVECRVDADSSRPSRHPESDTIEFRYKVNTDDSGSPTPPAPPAPEPGGSGAWQGPFHSGKARFKIQLPENAAGKLLILQARWKNIVDDSKSGPWSEEVSARVTW